ncbi:MAG: hypothetical protein ABIQ31_08155 [Ferruginibacter sp.]
MQRGDGDTIGFVPVKCEILVGFIRAALAVARGDTIFFLWLHCNGQGHARPLR